MVAVNYKSRAAVVETVSSIRAASAEIDCIVVDNASGSEELVDLRNALTVDSRTFLLESMENLGYFGAARIAFKHHVEFTKALPDWVIVCNHDVQIADEGFFSKLRSWNPAGVGMIAPSIRTVPGSVEQNPFMRHRPGRWSWSRTRLVSSNYKIALVWDWLWRQKSKLKSWFAVRKSAPRHRKQRESVYAPHGSFLIFSRRFFECGGFLDDNLFLYGEEISVAEICRELQLSVVFDPSLQVLHAEHHSTGSTLSRFTFECQRNSVRYLTSRYFGRSFKDSNTASASVS